MRAFRVTVVSLKCAVLGRNLTAIQFRFLVALHVFISFFNQCGRLPAACVPADKFITKRASCTFPTTAQALSQRAGCTSQLNVWAAENVYSTVWRERKPAAKHVAVLPLRLVCSIGILIESNTQHSKKKIKIWLHITLFFFWIKRRYTNLTSWTKQATHR